jgi:DNA modification methylase
MLEHIKLSDLIPYVNNAKTHPEEQVTKIAASIKEFGPCSPILVDKDNGIVAGHGRLLAAKKLGLDTFPCVRLEHLNEAQRKAYILADNRLGEVGGSEWDTGLVSLELEWLKEDGFGIDLTGFDDSFIMLDEVDGLTDEDEVPEVPEDPVTVLGDVWLCGQHRLHCGDSTSIDAVEKLCNGRFVDMLLTDPPYNVEYVGKTKEAMTIQNDSMDDSSFREFLRDAFVASDTAMKAGAVFYIWHADSEGYNFRGACDDAGWKVRQCLIWKKQTLVMGRQDYHWKHEPCLYGWKDGAGHLWATDRKQTTILEFDRQMRNGEHPTMKPVALFEYQMLNNTKGGDIILDVFGGSGTTMIAAEKNGRVGYVMELDPKYSDVIIKRWQEFSGKDAILESTGQLFNEIANG